jgi:GT2 family glycosyltransferase
MDIGIIIITYNLPSEILLLQVAAIKKFCKDDYAIELIDNSSNLEMAKNIKYHANQLGIPYIKTFANSENGSDSHTWACNFAYQRFKDDYKYMLFLDHDCIPVQEFSIVEILGGGHVIAGLGQGQRKKYMWAGLVMFANERIDKSIVDFSTNSIYGLDTGGNLYLIVEKYGEENCIFFNEAYYQNQYYNGKTYNHYAMLNNGGFLHFVNSSLWTAVENNEARVNGLINIAKEKTGL